MDSKDTDALGLTPTAESTAALQGISTEQAVWNELRTVFDPEIPVNVADLGLIYSCVIRTLPENALRVEIEMTLTAPGCGMAEVLKTDIERKLSRLPDVKEVSVRVVFDPPWDPSRMSDAAKLQLGLDLDFSPVTSALPIFKPVRR
jgi:probable FeS assembly SUF system protein SufT